MNALVRLLYDGALRIQDAVGLKFDDILSLKVNQYGERKLFLIAKKTTARSVTLSQDVYDAVK